MVTFHEAPADVLALTVEGKLTGEELSRIMDRLEEALAANDKLHLFIEVLGFDWLELKALPSYMARAMPLFGKLRQFGRVAVVADQAWIRVGTRMESAILPFIAYRVFEPAERAAAWAFATGEDGAA